MSIEQLQFRQPEKHEIGDLALVMDRANAQRDGRPLPGIDSDASYDALADRMRRVGAWTHVAVDNREYAGFVLTHPLIDPDYWGKRVASQLVDIVIERARENSRHSITLWTREADNERARIFYTRKGFMRNGLARGDGLDTQIQYQLDLD